MRPCTRRIASDENFIKATSLDGSPRRTRSLVQNRPRRTPTTHQASKCERIVTGLTCHTRDCFTPTTLFVLGAKTGRVRTTTSQDRRPTPCTPIKEE